MTCNVFGGMLNLALSIYLSLKHASRQILLFSATVTSPISLSTENTASALHSPPWSQLKPWWWQNARL